MDHCFIVASAKAAVKGQNGRLTGKFEVFRRVVGLCFLAATLLELAAPASGQMPKRIACVGDSITEGNANADFELNSWPQILDRLLERDFPGKFQARNFGRSGATLLKNGHKPYWAQDVFQSSSEYLPQIVILNLGTNDAVARNWEAHGSEFEADLRALIRHYQSLAGSDGGHEQPQIWLSNLTPMHAPHPLTAECEPNRVVVEQIISKLAAEFEFGVIDFKTPLIGKRQLLPDGLHPNTAGNELMAMAAYQALTAKEAAPDASIHPLFPLEGVARPLISGGENVGMRMGGWRKVRIEDGATGAAQVAARQGPTAWLAGTGAKNELTAAFQIADGDFLLSARLRMLGQKNSAAGFFINQNFFGFEGARGTAFRNGPQMKGLRMLHPAELLWERDSWIDFHVLRRGATVWFMVNDLVVDMALIRGPIERFGFDPTRSEMQISELSVVGHTRELRLPQLQARSVNTPWIDLSMRAQQDGLLRVGGAFNFVAGRMTSANGKQVIEFRGEANEHGNSLVHVSVDGGASWGYSLEVPVALSGQWHQPQLLPDGSWAVIFWDNQPASPTRNSWVAWVGTVQDVLEQKEGRWTCKLLQARPKPLVLSLDGKRILPAMSALLPTRGYHIPLVDLDQDEGRHIVVDREPGQYLGHVSTELLEDGKTILAVYPKGHGRGPIVYKRSADGGKTWTDRLPTPESWATSKEVPTIHRVIDPNTGKKRLILWSGLYPARLAVSEDDGATWSALESAGDWGGIVVMGFVERMKNGDYIAMFHDDGRFIGSQANRENPPVFTLYQVRSTDGGLTWSEPDAIWTGSDIHLCEPGCVRSPDGSTLAVLLRENSRRRNSYVIFSTDEGKTWTPPRELPASLTGDRHTGQYMADGRLFLTFRDTAHQSPSQGDWVGWVGTWEDLYFGRPGQYRVRIKDNKHRWDTTYPGVELLPDGTMVTTTYGHWDEGEQPYILCARFKPEELDAKAAALPNKQTLFGRGMEGVHTYRIPALVTTNDGSLIACCDARLNSSRDLPNDIYTVIRRSTDGGRSWSQIREIHMPKLGEGTADPCMVVDRQSGRVWCAITWSESVGWYNSKPGYGRDSFHNLLIYSDDDGLSWSSPIDITKSIKEEEWISAWFSPGSGIQAESGRLLIPYSAAHTRDEVYSYVAVSDDHGKTWGHVGPTGSDTNESMVAQLADGTLISNMRSTAGLNQRAISKSNNNGDTWEAQVHDAALVEPVCQASLLTIAADLTPDGREWLVFCNPASNKRENLTLKVSFDCGATWPIAKLLHAGPTAYSCMSLLPGGGIGVLYEAGENSAYERIDFAQVPLHWLLEGAQ